MPVENEFFRNYYSSLPINLLKEIQDIGSLEFGFFFREGTFKRGVYFSNVNQLRNYLQNQDILSFHHSINLFKNPWETRDEDKIIVRKRLVLDIDLPKFDATFRSLCRTYRILRKTLKLLSDRVLLSPLDYQIYFSGRKGFHLYFSCDDEVVQKSIFSFLRLFSLTLKEGPLFEYHLHLLLEAAGYSLSSEQLCLCEEDFLGIEGQRFDSPRVLASIKEYGQILPLDVNCYLDRNRLIKSTLSLHRSNGFRSLLMPDTETVIPSFFEKAIPPSLLQPVEIFIPERLPWPFERISSGTNRLPKYLVSEIVGNFPDLNFFP